MDEEKKVIGYDFDFHIPNITEEDAALIYDVCLLMAKLLGQDDISGGGVFPVYENGEAEDGKEAE